MVQVGERQQKGRGKTQKIICPKCEKEYLKTAGGREGKTWKRIGLYCPNPECDYIIKDSSELEEEEEAVEDTDKAEKIKKLTEEFMKTHDRLNELAEQIKELETE